MKKKFKLLAICAITMGIGVCTSFSSVSTPPTSATEEVSSSIGGNKDFADKVEDAWNTYLVPILGTVSVASIASALVNIGFTIINKRLNAKNKQIIADSCEKNKAVILETITFSKELIDSTQSLLSEIKNSNSLQEETKELFSKTTREMEIKIIDLIKKTEDMQKIKPILITLGNIEAKVAEKNKEAISSGLTAEINLLVEQLKNFN